MALFAGLMRRWLKTRRVVNVEKRGPRRGQFSGKKRRSRRVCKADRLTLCAMERVRYSGRQWRKLRKRLSLEERAQILASAP